MDRTQTALFSPTLDAMIPPDNPVRLFDEILRQVDWRAWENHYVLVHGQPPIHPRIVASVLLYGLSQGIRSSRRLERMCGNGIDFLWLAEGHSIDHSTFCQFRTRFSKELKDLFRQVGRIALGMGVIRLNHIALDGTCVRACTRQAATAEHIEQCLKELDPQIEKMLDEVQKADRKDADLFGESVSPNRLPRELADMKRRQERLKKALERAKREQAAQKHEPAEGQPQQEPNDEKNKKKKKKRKIVPLTDVEAPNGPDKAGVTGPNYTPVAGTAVGSGFIVAEDVLADGQESEAVIPAVEQVRENLGQAPGAVLADCGLNSGPVLRELAEQKVEAYIPLGTRKDTADNPARREALDQPVAAEQWDKLPVDRRTKRVGRTAFVYDAGKDCYWCPMGKAMGFQRIVYNTRAQGTIESRRYRCAACGQCPLKQRCLGKKTELKFIDRDEYEPYREAMDARLRTEEGRKVYSQRAPWIEGTFGFIKSTVGVRQFLLRGLEKVRTEWRWICTAVNVVKLATALAARRAATMCATAAVG
jgi:transposase